jgi:hypothetical protein
MAGTAFRTAAIGLVGLLAGCLGTDPTEPEVRVCAPPEVDTSDWREVSSSVFSFRIPTSYTRVEGSNRWQLGRAWIEPVLLEPGEGTDETPEPLADYNECRVNLNGRTLLIQLGVTTIGGRFGRGIYMAGNWGTVSLPPLVGGNAILIFEAWTPSEITVEEFWAIIWSTVVTEGG